MGVTLDLKVGGGIKEDGKNILRKHTHSPGVILLISIFPNYSMDLGILLNERTSLISNIKRSNCQ